MILVLTVGRRDAEGHYPLTYSFAALAEEWIPAAPVTLAFNHTLPRLLVSVQSLT
jgi:hypothetical protein